MFREKLINALDFLYPGKWRKTHDNEDQAIILGLEKMIHQLEFETSSRPHVDNAASALFHIADNCQDQNAAKQIRIQAVRLRRLL